MNVRGKLSLCLSRIFSEFAVATILYGKIKCLINPLSANFTKWSDTLKQFVGNLPTNCLSVFGHFVRLALKGLNN